MFTIPSCAILYRSVPLGGERRERNLRRRWLDHVGSGLYSARSPIIRAPTGLSPLRRFLEAQTGRPWDAVYSEIAANLKVTSTVQQHVRDHLKDFVHIHRRPAPWSLGPWFEPLYVNDEGVLRRTFRRSRARLRSPTDEQDRVRLADNLELRKIAGHWYEITLGRLPEPAYRPVARLLKQPTRPYAATSSMRVVEVVVRQLVTSAVTDAVTGKPVFSGPEIDETDAWRRYLRRTPTGATLLANGSSLGVSFAIIT